MLKPTFNKKVTRAERRAQERLDRRRARRPTFDEVKKEIELRRDTEMLKHWAGNNYPIGHEINRTRMHKTFAPIEAMLDEIQATGEVDVGPDNKPIIKPKGEYEYYPVVEAFRSMAETFELIAEDRKLTVQTEGIRRIANKWDYGMMIDQSDLDAARACLQWMRLMIAPLTPEQFGEYSLIVSARAELARIDQEARLNRRK